MDIPGTLLYFLSLTKDFFAFLWYIFVQWLSLFFVPFTHFETLWIIIPIWATWILTEVFQEKDRTRFGNAVSNGIIPLWAALDWLRYLVDGIQAHHTPMSWVLVMKFGVCAIVFAYGVFIIHYGIKGRHFIHYMGRARDVAYVLLVFTPVIYDAASFSIDYLIGIILFFPLFYFIVEWIDRHTPNPGAMDLDKRDG